jgi:hypothetical protein
LVRAPICALIQSFRRYGTTVSSIGRWVIGYATSIGVASTAGPISYSRLPVAAIPISQEGGLDWSPQGRWSSYWRKYSRCDDLFIRKTPQRRDAWAMIVKGLVEKDLDGTHIWCQDDRKPPRGHPCSGLG